MTTFNFDGSVTCKCGRIAKTGHLECMCCLLKKDIEAGLHRDELWCDYCNEYFKHVKHPARSVCPSCARLEVLSAQLWDGPNA